MARFKKNLIHIFLLFFWIGILSINTGINPVYAQKIRKPVYDGRFYPKDRDALLAQINEYTNLAQKTPVFLPPGKTLKALILPHAGYIYSGLTAAHADFVLKGKHFDKVVIMGPDHRVGFTGCAITDSAGYETPLGIALLHPDAKKLRKLYPSIFQAISASDQQEHCIEVELPFLQSYLHQFKIVPIVMGQGDIRQYLATIDDICDKNTLVVVSSDLSHYLPYSEAVQRDKQTIQMILDLNTKKLSNTNNRACGINPIQVLVQLALRHQWKPMLLHYSNSGDTAGTRDRVVGYAAIVFYEDIVPTRQKEPRQKGYGQMDKAKGDVLLKLARKTIADKLGINTEESIELKSSLSDDIFASRRGTFVTLKINDRLRGCIGNLEPDKTIIEGVKDNAVNAAFHDPRFPALSKQELAKVDIEVSLLTKPRELKYKDADDLLNKLRVNIDGVIIRKGFRSSTFLPQVWEQLPDKKMFLEHLCMKAGLPENAWKEPGLKVMTYQVQYFDEKN